MITQKEYNVAKQGQRELHYLFNILNYKFQKVDEISGVVLGASFAIDATSDIRRTATITLTPDNPDYYKAQSGSKIWADKYIQIYVGIKNLRNSNDEIVYTNMGIYMINNPSQVFNSTDNTITLNLLDLMAKMTGQRNGYLDGVEYQIKKDSDIREAIIAILKECGFEKYVIQINSKDYQKTQNDIAVDATGTYYDLLTEINAINTDYQMYFDLDGVFHYEKIPDGQNEQNMVDDDLWQYCYISHETSISYEDIKNHIIVLGKTHDITYYSSDTPYANGIYTATIAELTALQKGTIIGFTSKVNASNAQLKLNSLGTYPIKNENGSIPSLKKDTYYVLEYADSYWKFLGEVTPKGVAMENNPDSPYYVGGSFGDVKIVLSGSDYDNISSDDLAQQRAKWELYTRCKIYDNVTMECVPIYWLDVNWVISITFPNESQPRQYIIKKIDINGSVDGQQTVTLMRYYPFYEQ